MTAAELIDFCRLQVDEPNDSYWDEFDWGKYIRIGLEQFLSKTKAGLYRETIPVDTTKVKEDETIHVMTMQMIDDSPGGGTSIHGKSFIIYDTDDNAYTFIFTTAGTITSAADIAAKRYYIQITAADLAATIATKVNLAIAGATAVPVTSTVANDTLTITWDETGYTTGISNVNVTNGLATLTIITTTQGYNNGYELKYQISQEKTIIRNDTEAGDVAPMKRVGYEDYSITTSDERQYAKLCIIDVFKNKIVHPFSTGSVTVQYYILPRAEDYETIIEKFVLPDFSLAIAWYALFLATARDKNVVVSRDYYSRFRGMTEDAMKEISKREPSNETDSFDLRNYNPHLETNLPGMSGLFGRGESN